MSRRVYHSKLSDLPAPQRAELVRWLMEEKCTYRGALQRLESQFAVHSNLAAISRFWTRICKPFVEADTRLRDCALDLTLSVWQGGRVIAQTTLRAALAPGADLLDGTAITVQPCNTALPGNGPSDRASESASKKQPRGET